MLVIKQISRYKIEELLGEGSMGRVYKGYDPSLERWVAIKTMRTNEFSDQDAYTEFKERFFLESKVYARLNHPNIVSVYDGGVHERDPFLVMEFIDGRPLEGFVREKGDERFKLYVSILQQIAAGLDYAHEEGVIHRDIKPGNVLIDGKQRVKIVDFGLARLIDSKLTQSGLFLGTPSYSSPEQIISGRVDSRSDVYSFGTVAYELLTGKLPFEAESLHSILYQIANQPPNISLDQFAYGFDVHALTEVFLKVFHKQPEARYQSAGEFVKDLKVLLGGLSKVKINTGEGDRQTLKLKALKPDAVEPHPSLPPMPPKLDDPADLRLQSLIGEARKQFQAALKTRNLSSTRYCLTELRRLGADAVEESRLLAALEDELDSHKLAHREHRAEAMVQKARSEFNLALAAGNLASSRYCLNELVRLGAVVETETKAFQKLEQQVKDEEARRALTLEEKEKAERKIKRLRGKFNKAIKEEHLSLCKRILVTLKEAEVPIKLETKALAQLKEKLDREADQRRIWIAKTRALFQKALQQEAIDQCQRILLELKNLLKVDVEVETAALAQLEADLRSRETVVLQQKFIANTRRALAQACDKGDLARARSELKQLKALGVDATQEEALVVETQKSIEQRESLKIKENMAHHFRRRFRDAIERKNLENARYYLRELSQLADQVGRETRELGQLEAYLIPLTQQQQQSPRDDEERLKQRMIDQFRIEFMRSLEARQTGNCRYYLHELEQLGEEVSSEYEAVQLLEKQQGTA